MHQMEDQWKTLFIKNKFVIMANQVSWTTDYPFKVVEIRNQPEYPGFIKTLEEIKSPNC